MEDAVADERDERTGLRDTLDLRDVARPIEPMCGLRSDSEVDARISERALLGGLAAILDVRMRECGVDLCLRWIGRDDELEVLRERDRELAVTAAGVPRELAISTSFGERGREQPRITRPIGGVARSDRREVISEAQGYRPWNPTPTSKPPDSQRENSIVSPT